MVFDMAGRQRQRPDLRVLSAVRNLIEGIQIPDLPFVQFWYVQKSLRGEPQGFLDLKQRG